MNKIILVLAIFSQSCTIFQDTRIYRDAGQLIEDIVEDEEKNGEKEERV